MPNQFKPVVPKNPVPRVKYGSQPSLTVPVTPATPDLPGASIKLKVGVQKPVAPTKDKQIKKERRKQVRVLSPSTGSYTTKSII